MRVSDIIIDELVSLGISHCFSVTGGATMHLNDSVGSSEEIQTTYMHHEQACAMAAEGYARISLKPALVVVTAGPGALNALNGIFGAFTDSIPMFVLMGQSKRETLKRNYEIDGLRQLGDQEASMIDICKHLSKEVRTLNDVPSELQVREIVRSLHAISVTGRPGPVILEVPVDIQGASASDSSTIYLPLPEKTRVPECNDASALHFLKLLSECRRPVFLLGSGALNQNVVEAVVQFCKRHRIPIVTAWAHDTIDNTDELFVGRPGTIGTRPGNFIVQNADLLVVLGSRLNIRQIGYNFEAFAKLAKIIQVDIDSAELEKPFPIVDFGIHSSIEALMNKISVHEENSYVPNFSRWLGWAREINDRFELKPSDYESKDAINPYLFFMKLSDYLPERAILVCGDATACIVPFQTIEIKNGIRMFSNSGCASMGYDLPAAIGAAVSDRSRNVFCFAGDGSIMMNIQELQTIFQHQLNIKIFVLCNDGYLSIRQTQTNFFGREFGSDSDSGLTFPNFQNIASAFGLRGISFEVLPNEEEFQQLMNFPGPLVISLKIDPNQEFAPRIKSRMIQGVIHTPELDDMYPFLPDEVIQEVRESAQRI